MRGIATIGIDNDFPTGETAISIRSADNEISGGIDQKIAWTLRHPAARQRRSHCILDHIADHSGRIFLAVAILRVVLGRDHDLGAAAWLLASGCKSNSAPERRLSESTLRILCAK